ncbi:MAG TPA: hypothetical protein VFJ81_09840, partial [Gemmatimonadales bacterium]|nr:hypothetical protein [Gemmatimonadales bacterium]
TAGFVSRRRHGLFVHYQLADRDVLRLCEIMCDRLGKELRLRRQEVGTALGGRKDGRTEGRKDGRTSTP